MEPYRTNAADEYKRLCELNSGTREIVFNGTKFDNTVIMKSINRAHDQQDLAYVGLHETIFVSNLGEVSETTMAHDNEHQQLLDCHVDLMVAGIAEWHAIIFLVSNHQ